ncbi:MAG: AcrR family transcriptional regulator [Myxococcota bacterium]|jgi:AcrR family transcriptional regulator
MPKIVDHAQRRDAIAQIAAQLIAEGGLEAATVREIARVSGFSKGIVEHYFDDKGELINAALERANQAYFARVAQMTEGKTGLAALRARLAATVPSNATLRSEWKIRLIFWSVAAVDPVLQKQQAKRSREAIAHFAADLQDARIQGEVASSGDLEPIARQVLFAATGLSCAILHNPRTYTKAVVDAEIERIVSMSTMVVGG